MVTGLLDIQALSYLGISPGDLTLDEKAELLFVDQRYGKMEILLLVQVGGLSCLSSSSFLCWSLCWVKNFLLLLQERGGQNCKFEFSLRKVQNLSLI